MREGVGQSADALSFNYRSVYLNSCSVKWVR